MTAIEVEGRRGSAMEPVEALRRGLAVLSAIGQDGADPASLSRSTRLNRTTVYRILTTLEADGYVSRSPSDHRFRLTPKVRLLSDGFTDALWITHIAMPALMQLLKETSWPGNVATFDGRHMVFRESTHRFSSFLVHRPMINRAIPLSTSLGRAYLAFAGDAVRRPLLPAFQADWRASGFGELTASTAEQLLHEVRDAGYAVAIGALEKGVGAIAMPVMRSGQVLACLNVVVPGEVLGSPELLTPIREGLKKATGGMERRLDLERETLG